MKLKMISNRGTKVYPAMGAITDCVDQWRCRFMVRDSGREVDDAGMRALLSAIEAKHSWMHIEKLRNFDGVPGYTKAQGED